MIEGDLAILFNLLSIGVVGVMISVSLLSVLWMLIKDRIDNIPVDFRKTFLFFLAFLPWVIGLVTMFFFSVSFKVFPEVDETTVVGWLLEHVHWHHLNVFSLNSWHTFTLVTFLSFCLWLAIKKVYQTVSQRRSLNTFLNFSERYQSDKVPESVVMLNTDQVMAFTIGLLRPVCVLSRGLLKHLSKNELDMVVQHEKTHIENLDGLSRTFFSFLASFFPQAVTHSMCSKYWLATEQIADQGALAKHDSLNIAATLVKVAKLQRSCLPAFSASNSFAYEHVPTRINSLLSPVQPKPFPACSLMFSVVLIMLTITISMLDLQHHLIELVFTH